MIWSHTHIQQTREEIALSFYLPLFLSVDKRRKFRWVVYWTECIGTMFVHRRRLIVMLRVAQEVAEAVSALEDAGGIPDPVSILHFIHLLPSSLPPPPPLPHVWNSSLTRTWNVKLF